MKKNQFPGMLFLPVLLLVLSISCKKENRESAENKNEAMTSGVAAKKPDTDLVKDVRSATSRFHSTTQAIKAGYIPDDHCVSAPGLGGMGYHWANPTLVDPVFNPLEPEVVLYASGPNGKPRLVAVEYIVLNVGQPRPMFGDHPFDIGGTPVPAPHWSLHVWLFEDNPTGIFTPFNPNVSCP